MNVSGKVVLITGASRGLGRVMALGLAAAGANVAITARPGSEAALAAVVDAAARACAKGEVAAFIGDVSAAAVCASIVESTLQRFGVLHVLFNNAALGMDKCLLVMLLPTWSCPRTIRIAPAWCRRRRWCQRLCGWPPKNRTA